MIQPPRTTARLLESISASTDFSHGVLGDLAEMFNARAQRDGLAAATRAYNRDAIRAAPFLIRDWARSLKGEALEHYVSTVVATFILAVFYVAIVGMAATRTLDALHVHGPPPLPRTWGVWRLAIAWIPNAVLVFTAAIVPGFVTAWLSERPALMNAIGVGVLWSGIVVYLSIVTGAPPLWYRFIFAAAGLAGTTVGAVLRVRTLRFADDQHDSGASGNQGMAAS